MSEDNRRLEDLERAFKQEQNKQSNLETAISIAEVLSSIKENLKDKGFEDSVAEESARLTVMNNLMNNIGYTQIQFALQHKYYSEVGLTQKLADTIMGTGKAIIMKIDETENR